MKKYIVSILITSVFLISTPLLTPTALAADMSIRDFINFLVIIGVITSDKMPAVNAYLASLDNNQATNSSPSISAPAPTLSSSTYVYGKEAGRVYGSGLLSATLYFNGSMVNPTDYTYVTDSQISFMMPTFDSGTYPIYVKSDDGTSNTINMVVN